MFVCIQAGAPVCGWWRWWCRSRWYWGRWPACTASTTWRGRSCTVSSGTRTATSSSVISRATESSGSRRSAWPAWRWRDLSLTPTELSSGPSTSPPRAATGARCRPRLPSSTRCPRARGWRWWPCPVPGPASLDWGRAPGCTDWGRHSGWTAPRTAATPPLTSHGSSTATSPSLNSSGTSQWSSTRTASRLPSSASSWPCSDLTSWDPGWRSTWGAAPVWRPEWSGGRQEARSPATTTRRPPGSPRPGRSSGPGGAQFTSRRWGAASLSSWWPVSSPLSSPLSSPPVQ